MMSSKLIILGVILAMTTTSRTIQWSSKSNICEERNLSLLCQCNHLNKILNVSSFGQQYNVHNSVHDIIIEKCDRVFLGTNSLASLKSLRKLQIISVSDLMLAESALNWTGYKDEFNMYEQPRLNIIIKDTIVTKVAKTAFRGGPGEIILERSQFDLLEPFAFSSLNSMSLFNIQHCQFKNIQSQAFKGIQTKKLIINNSTFKNILPSSAFRDIDITETFTISNSKFGTIKPSAFIIKQPYRFEILNSYFDTIESEGFLVRTKGGVILKNNTFSNLNDRAFMGISYMKESRNIVNQELQFIDNKINSIKPISFNRTSFTPKYGAIILNQTCSCVDITYNEIKDFVQCVEKHQTIPVKTFQQRVCQSGTKTWVILVAVFSVILVVVIVAIVVVVILYRRYKKRKQKEYVNRGQNKKGSVGLIVPDGRTYRETEVHVIVEKAELLTTEL